MTRILPGVYVTLNDYSTLPEGENNLTVGYVLKANRGPVNKCELVVSPTDFLQKYTFSGAPSPTDDKTFWSILQVLRQTNQIYVSRASKNAKFGGLVIKKDIELGKVLSTTKANTTNGGKIVVEGDATSSLSANDIFRVFTTSADDLKAKGYYKVLSTAYTPVTGTNGSTEITLAKPGATDKDFKGMEVTIAQASDSTKAIKNVAPVALEAGIDDPENYVFTSDDLFLIAGIDPGAYNNDIAVTIVSSAETPEELSEANVFTISIYDANTGALLETPWMVNRTEGGKLFDGTASYINTVLESSAYIRGYNNTTVNEKLLPSNCNRVKLGGGSNGDTLQTEDYISALELLGDKTIPISILGNGTGTEYESAQYQQKMISIANERKDCVAFLNSRLTDEKATFNSTKATNVISYKKGDVGSTSFYGTMYAPHVNYTDAFNSRTIKLGADSTAIAGWLSVILNQGYPYAYAGPTYGLVSGVTTDWKIGDTSGEAELLNDASINYIAYDAKVGRYYMQAQNTLQIANSALRNLGAVLNVLDIKETFAVYFKEYLQRPITNSLRQEMVMKGKDQMNLYLSQGRVLDYSFMDATSDLDLANNTLRFVLTLVLTPYAQQIYLTMNIVNAGFDFSILQG